MLVLIVAGTDAEPNAERINHTDGLPDGVLVCIADAFAAADSFWYGVAIAVTGRNALCDAEPLADTHAVALGLLLRRADDLAVPDCDRRRDAYIDAGCHAECVT